VGVGFDVKDWTAIEGVKTSNSDDVGPSTEELDHCKTRWLERCLAFRVLNIPTLVGVPAALDA